MKLPFTELSKRREKKWKTIGKLVLWYVWCGKKGKFEITNDAKIAIQTVGGLVINWRRKKSIQTKFEKKIAKRTLIFTIIFSSARPLLFNPRAPLLPSAFWVLFDQISTIIRICDGLIINNWYRTLRIIEKHIYFVLRFNVTEWTEPADWWHDIPCRANTHTIAQHINCAALKYSAMRMK